VHLNASDVSSLPVPAAWTDLYSSYVRVAGGGIYRSEPRRILCDLISMHSVIAGDILDVAKKHVMYRKDLDLDKLRRLLLQDCWVVRGMANVMGVDEDRLRELNMTKLLTGPNARYKTGQYSDEAAQARADKQCPAHDVADYACRACGRKWEGVDILPRRFCKNCGAECDRIPSGE
jgi:hypothetical protein